LAVVKFTANSDNLSYSLSGNYSYANASSDPNNVYANFGVFLLDQTANAVVFRNVQSALGTLAFDMTVGGTFQDVVGGPPELEGSLSGALINGHVYEFSYTADTRYGTVDSSGNVLLTITSEASAVPEPASLMLCGLGTIGLIAGGLRRRCRAV
jgi:hypothetical protein